MKILTLGTLFIGSLFSTVYADAAPERMWEEKEIVSSDYEEKYYDVYLLRRAEQLCREGDYLRSMLQLEASEKCYEKAGYLLEEIREPNMLCDPIHHLFVGLCFENSAKEKKSLARKHYKKCYEIVFNTELTLEGQFAFRYNIPYLNAGALAAFLYGDEKVFAQFLYMQMVLADPKTFTNFIIYMEELQLLASQKFSKDHWIIQKMKTQMEKKLIKELEESSRLDTIEYKRGALISLFNPPHGMTVEHVKDHLEIKFPHS